MHDSPAQFSSFPPEAEGMVMTYFSDFYTVKRRDGSRVICKRKALLKKQGIAITVGDYVTLEGNATDETAWITQVLPQHTFLEKPKIANVQQVLVVVPWQSPEFSPRQADRLLSKVMLAGFTPHLAFTKIDLATPDECIEGKTLVEWEAYYRDVVGITVLHSSIYAPDRVEAVREFLTEHRGIWVLAGVSGAGKSSLLNTLDERFHLKVNDVSDKSGRGTHTTRHTEILEMQGGILIADAPGFSQLDFSSVPPTSVVQAFPELERHAVNHPCAYEDCLHHHEADCAIKLGVDAGTLLLSRYTHYTEILEEALAGETTQQAMSHKREMGSVKTSSKKGKKAVSVVRLNPELRDKNRKQNKQDLKQLEQYIQQQQRLDDDGLDEDDVFLDGDGSLDG
jgi:ribosome biogenesis GTPase / thiamine phosphate phosphatase